MIIALLPLAITMVMEPQILTAIVFVTRKNAIKISLSYLFGIAIAVCTGLLFFFVVARLFGLKANASGQPSEVSQVIQLVAVLGLIALALRTYLKRKTSKTPSWLLGLEKTSPSGAFKLGLLLIYLMPGDVIVMLAVATHIAANGVHSTDILKAIPFVALTLLLASSPLLIYSLFHRRAAVVMPRVGKWMETHSWLVNIIVYIFFIFLILR